MEIGNIFGMGLGGAAILGAVFVGIQLFFGKTPGQSEKLDWRAALQLEKQKKIDSIEQEQTKIIAEIKKTEQLAPESQIKIQAIVNEASAKVQEVIKEDNLGKLTESYNNDMKDL